MLDTVEYLAATEDAVIDWLEVDDYGRVHADTLAAAIAENPADVALISVMWANNEVGTVNPVRELAEVGRRHGIPLHTDAVQAVGALPVDFARSGADALTFTGHKLGGPVGVGALLLRREVAVEPILHGGGQERGVRSGTLDVAGIVGLAAAVTEAVRRRVDEATRLAALRDRLVREIRAIVPDAVVSGDPGGSGVDGGPSRLPGNAHLRFPGCEGDSLLMLLGRGGDRVLHRFRVHGRGRPAVARAAGHGGRRDRCSWCAAVLVGSYLDRGRGRRAARGDRTGGRAGPTGDGRRESRPMRVLAAMSGGVDSAVAAALAVDAGHQVTGVHMALSRQPGTLRTGSRGCCTVEDAFDARRVCDLLGIAYYVWDFSAEFAETVVGDFLDEYRAGRTPNPCLRCNEKIKFAALLDRAMALGFDAVVTGHHVRLVDGVLQRSVDQAKDQSYVLAVLTREQLAHTMFPLGEMTKEQVRAEAARRGFAVAAKPDSYDICFIPEGDTHGYLVEKLGAQTGSVVDAETGEQLAEHDGYFAYTIGQRKGLRLGRPAEDGRPRYVLGIEPVSGTVTVGTADRLDVSVLTGERIVWSTGTRTGVPVAEPSHSCGRTAGPSVRPPIWSTAGCG